MDDDWRYPYFRKHISAYQLLLVLNLLNQLLGIVDGKLVLVIRLISENEHQRSHASAHGLVIFGHETIDNSKSNMLRPALETHITFHESSLASLIFILPQLQEGMYCMVSLVAITQIVVISVSFPFKPIEILETLMICGSWLVSS